MSAACGHWRRRGDAHDGERFGADYGDCDDGDDEEDDDDATDDVDRDAIPDYDSRCRVVGGENGDVDDNQNDFADDGNKVGINMDAGILVTITIINLITIEY